MPELPEVETTRRLLAPVLHKRRILSAQVLHPRMLRRQPDPTAFASRLEGRVVHALGRRGKFLLFEIGDGYVWVTHLGMSGRIAIKSTGEDHPPHTRVAIRTDSDREIGMVDPRTFGFMAVYSPSEMAASTLSTLGPDALTALPPTEHLVRAATGRKVPIKTLLLDQRFLAGLGNIYASEVLFEAGVDGARAAGSLDPRELSAIRRAIGSVLDAGLAHGRDLVERPRLPAAGWKGRAPSGIPIGLRPGG